VIGWKFASGVLRYGMLLVLIIQRLRSYDVQSLDMSDLGSFAGIE
jgi:hypothetical protein